MQPSAIEANADDTLDRRFQCVAPIVKLFNQIGNCICLILQTICVPFKDFFASVQRASKRDNNNRTPGEGTCFELGKYRIASFFFLSFQFQF